MALIQSGLDTTLATVDPTSKALYVKLHGGVDFSHDDTTLDSFERLRVSDARIEFESSFGAMTPTLMTTVWEVGTVGAGTTEALTTNLYGCNLTLPVTTSVGRWIQSYYHVRYAPGISTMLRFTFNFNGIATNIRSRIGMFTDQGTFPSTAGDGLYLEDDAGTIAVVRRYMTQGAGSEQRVLQSAWNLNRMAGAGDVADSTKNIVTLDWSKAQHLVIEYQYLGVGTVRFGFETGPSGVVWCHEIHSVNSLVESWARTGSLPVRAETYNYGAASISSLTIMNCVVLQEGDIKQYRGWKYFSGDTGTTAKTGGTAIGLYPLMGIRAAGTNDLTKRVKIVPTSITINVITAGTVGVTPIKVALLVLGTPNTAASYAVTVGGSAVVVDNAATASTAITGTAIWSGVVPNVIGTYVFDLTSMVDNANLIGTAASGTQAITGMGNLTLAAGPMVAAYTAAAALSATLNWKELG